MIRTLRVIRSNWSKNHRHHGGIRAVARCLLGTLALRAGLLAARRAEPAAVEVVTFSVVPWMTALWARLLGQALSHDRDARILIGDCSGGLGKARRGLVADPRVRILPCLNDHHGHKIDLFLARLCRAPYVVVADDDVFWLDDEPLAWAFAQLDGDPLVAAVSLVPRRDVSSALKSDNVARPMGSHCLVIRRDLWRRERLSFAVAPPPAGVDWFYDTGDLANRELLLRGYRVVIAGPEIERHLVAFDGISSWILKIQGHPVGRLGTAVADIPVRQRKALQAIHLARGMPPLVARVAHTESVPEIVAASRLDAAERVIEPHMSSLDRAAAHRMVAESLGRIRESSAYARLCASRISKSISES